MEARQTWDEQAAEAAPGLFHIIDFNPSKASIELY